MPQALFVHDGEYIDFMPAADVAPGDVIVQGDLIGVSKRHIAADELGSLAITGVFDIAKASADVITAGAKVYWKADDEHAVTTASGNKLLGKAVQAAGAGTTTVRVLLTH